MLYAEKTAAQKVQEEPGLHAAPEVHVDSFPFVAQLVAPAADKMDDSDSERTTGEPLSPGQLLKGSAIDALAEHWGLLKPAGIDPSLIRGLQKVQGPEVAKRRFSAKLPDSLPGDIRLRDIPVEKHGVRTELTGNDVPLGDHVE